MMQLYIMYVYVYNIYIYMYIYIYIYILHIFLPSQRLGTHLSGAGPPSSERKEAT